MATWVQYTLVALGVVGAAGTWFRAWVAYRTFRFQFGKRVVTSSGTIWVSEHHG